MAWPKILIVDDRIENLVSLETLLADLPTQTVRATSGNEALALTLEHDFALVLLDVQMPGMDGFEVARLLHESSNTRHLPIIFISAVYSGDVFQIKGVESGAVDFIEKPIIPELLRGKVRLFLELHEYRQQIIDLSTREIVSQISDGMLIVNRNAEILLANPAAEKILGKEASQLLGSHFDTTPIPKKLQEISIPTASGEKLSVELNVASMKWSGEDVYIISMRDITERKKAEEQHLNLETQLRQKHKMEALGYMAGGMAHNFNNNLSIILGNIELSLMILPPDSEVIPLLRNTITAINRSSDLILKIVSYSRKQVQQKAPMQLTTIIDETIDLLRSTLPSTITLQKITSPECDSTFIDADASQIQEALINLCNNAIQAMNEKGELKILLESVDLRQQDIPAQYDCPPGHYAKLSVQDSGSGISPEILDKIFDPFFSTKEEYEGAGMGLATVQGMVVQHGGIITVNSILDQGAVFNLYFPIIEEPHREEPTPENTTLPRGTEHILFVDDDKMLACLGEKLLTKMGYQVSTMTESTEALKRFADNAEQFNLVITDQTMPQLSGKELIQKIKKIRPDIPTILCTGYSSQINKEDAQELGINAFMMKPLDLPNLAQTVRRVLNGEKNE